MKTTTLMILSIFSLQGCATVDKVQKVLIPISVPIKINVPKKPHLPIADLNKNSEPELVMKSYVATVKILNVYSDSLVHIMR